MFHRAWCYIHPTHGLKKLYINYYTLFLDFSVCIVFLVSVLIMPPLASLKVGEKKKLFLDDKGLINQLPFFNVIYTKLFYHTIVFFRINLVNQEKNHVFVIIMSPYGD